MSNKFKILFFGSFQHYSVKVLEKLKDNFEIVGVVTTPPKPAGRHLKIKHTETAQFAAQKNLPLFELETLKEIPNQIEKPDFIVVAGYGKLIPEIWLNLPNIMAINLHPSLLPKYPGPMPGEWAILNNEKVSGVTLIKMSPRFDDGEILVQSPLEISDTDTRITFYERAFELGANLLIDSLPKIAKGELVPIPQPKSNEVFYARKLTRQDGYVPCEEFQLGIRNLNLEFTRKWRALAGWPGVWTINPDGKRLKLVDLYQKTTKVEGEN